MSKTIDVVMDETTNDYLDQADMANPPTPAQVQGDILENIRVRFEVENQLRGGSARWTIPLRLNPTQLADVIPKFHSVANIAYAGLSKSKEYDLLCVYQTDGDNRGIYTASDDAFYNIIKQYCYSISTNDVKEVKRLISLKVERKTRCNDPNLIALNNGIFNYKTKQLMPFSPDIIFTAKSKVNYNPNAANKHITEPDGSVWDVESWMLDLFDGDTELADLIWKIIGAVIRPNVSWNKSAFFYSESGNNGKGTLCSFMREIAGNETSASIPLSEFSEKFALEPLIGASSIIVDENDVGTYIDKVARLKSIITGDPVDIYRKYKQTIKYCFKGFMVQCLNEMPKIRDKTESFYRRQLFVPFAKSFTGKTKDYIKDEYLKDADVLEYAVHKVLNMDDYYKLPEPEACKIALEEYKEFNDPLREYLAEMLPKFTWDLVPYDFMYAVYKAWYKENVSDKQQLKSKTGFTREVKQIIRKQYDDDWIALDTQERPKHLMSCPDKLIHKYNLEDWKNPFSRGADIDKMCIPKLEPNYRGIKRRHPRLKPEDDD